MEHTKSLELWQRQGGNVLVVQPFMDSLVVGAEGCYLWDADGNKILDLAAGQFCSVLGHGHKKFSERLKVQIDKLIHLGDQFLSPSVLEAAQRLAAVAPGSLNRVLFLSTGSEANECAMRIAKKVTGRTAMLAFTRGYYGVSLATRTLSSISDHPGAFDFQPAPAGQFKLLTPVSHRCPIGEDHPSCSLHCLDVSFEMLGEQLENVAAVIVEPVISAGGMIFPPKEYLQALHARAKSAGALFIVDEAQTGFGRCGRWFDIQNLELQPDILVVSKTAGNGYPAAAVVVSEEIAARLENSGFSHLSSHQNDPLAAAAVHAVIDIVEEEGLVRHSDETGGYFIARLRELQARHSLIREVRGRGLMIGLELSGAEHEGRPLAFEFAMLCERRGVHLTFSYYEPVIRFIPPLVISRSDIDHAIAVLDEALDVMRAGAHDLTDLIPRNERSGPYVRQMTNSAISPLKLVRKMWRTSPEQWVQKLKALM
jgi:2,2-dialkylglycine decarboxylase (pyruvate)